MKRFFLLVLPFCIAVSSFAAGSSAIIPVKKASDIFIPIGSTGMKISLQALSEIKIKEWETIAGYKMKLADKVGFKAAQRQLKQSINADGTLNSIMAEKAMKSGNGETGFHLGGFALGFLLGLIGVLIAYLIKDDKKRNRRKWAWIGLIAYVLLYVIFFI